MRIRGRDAAAPYSSRRPPRSFAQHVQPTTRTDERIAVVADHYHCPAPGCYWRIQHMTVCSRCGGPTVQQPNCCSASEDRPQKQ